MEGIVIYKGKYGATQQYASWLGPALHIPVVPADGIEGGNLSKYDFLVIGSSVYAGKLQIHQWLRENLAAIQGKKLFLFIVCATPPHEKDKLEPVIRKNIPEEIRNRCEVFFLHGRMIMKKLSLADRIVLRLGAMLAKTPADRKRMLQDFDAVKKENIIPMINAVLLFISGKKDLNIIVGNAV